LIDERGDSATFFCFFLESREHCQRVNNVLAENKAGAINFAENSWHFYPRWEHLLAGSTVTRSGWPFLDPGGKRRVVYDPELLPRSAELISRTLVYQVPVKMSSERLAEMRAALHHASKA
jgi:8-amino-3,8-dideoxy-alpha-D-manno-octulosonate transaminase